MDLQGLKDGMGFHKYGAGAAIGYRPPYESPSKMTPRDRDLIREIYLEGRATRRELAWAFGISISRVHDHTS